MAPDPQAATQGIVALASVVHNFLWFRLIDVLTATSQALPYLVVAPSGNYEMEWAEETIVRLRTLWDEGLSTAEIGRRLGVTKNAIVGKAHRLDLPARPSPIRRDGSGGAPRRPRPPRVAGPTLPPLSSASSATGPGVGTMILPRMAVLAPKPVPLPPLVRDQALRPRPP